MSNSETGVVIPPEIIDADVKIASEKIKDYHLAQQAKEQAKTTVVEAMDNLVPDRKKNREMDNPSIAPERLQQILPEVLAEKKDLLETIIWDVEYNREELGTLLSRLKVIKRPKNPDKNYIHPYEAAVTVLHAVGAFEADEVTLRDAQTAKEQVGGAYTQQHEQAVKESQENNFKNAFRKEMLRPEQVYESIRYEKRKFIDDDGKEQSALHMIVEFSISSWSKVPQSKSADADNKYLARCVETYLQSRYQWETNVFKDKKMQLIRCLPDGLAKNPKHANILAQFGIQEENIDGASISIEEIEDFVSRNTKIMGINNQDITSALGINTLLSRKKLLVKGRHGWCGDSNVEKTFVSQAMYEGRKYIDHLREEARLKGEEFDEDIEVIGMTADNMGIIRYVKEKFAAFKNQIKKEYSTASEKNGMFGIRNAGEVPGSLFGDEGYARDAFWEDNMVYGALGETDGLSNKILAEGWSYGGAGTLKYAARIAGYVEKAWKEKILNGDKDHNESKALLRTLNHEVHKARTAMLQGSRNLLLLGNISEYQRMISSLKKQIEHKEQELQNKVQSGLPHFEENPNVGHPDISYILNAPCLHKNAIFIMNTPGQGRLAGFLSKSSGTFVDLGILLKDVGVANIAAGKATLQTFAKLFTGIILPANGSNHDVNHDEMHLTLSQKKKLHHDTTEDELIKEAGEVHYKNYSSERNSAAVKIQTEDLKLNDRLTRDEVRLLGTHQGRYIAIAGLRDRLVGFTDLTRELSYINSENPCIVVDSGHFTAASDTVRYTARHISRILLGSSRQERDAFITGLNNLGNMGIGFEKGSSFRDQGYYDFNYRFRFFDMVKHRMNKEQEALRDVFYQKIDDAYRNNPYLQKIVRAVIPAIEPHLVMPSRRDLTSDEIALN